VEPQVVVTPDQALAVHAVSKELYSPHDPAAPLCTLSTINSLALHAGSYQFSEANKKKNLKKKKEKKKMSN
jgi:hypothetical protein